MGIIAANDVSKATVLGSGRMGAQISLSLACGGVDVALWGRRETSRTAAIQRIRADLDHMIAAGLVSANLRAELLGRIQTTDDLPNAVSGASFVLEAISEDLQAKQKLLGQVETHVAPDVVLSSTTSAICATILQASLEHPQRFAVAHYIQPGHLMRLVEVVPGSNTAEATTLFIVDLLERIGKRPVVCPDIPGFLFARIQHAILREFVSLVDRQLVTPEVCDTVLKEGYAVRLPAMGCFEHADLAGLDLIDSEPARAVWADLSNATTQAETMISKLRQKGQLGMSTGNGFYDWSKRDSDDFRRDRDKEIIRRLLIQAGAEVRPPASET